MAILFALVKYDRDFFPSYLHLVDARDPEDCSFTVKVYPHLSGIEGALNEQDSATAKTLLKIAEVIITLNNNTRGELRALELCTSKGIYTYQEVFGILPKDLESYNLGMICGLVERTRQLLWTPQVFQHFIGFKGKFFINLYKTL